jgi:hypothetical protein
MLVWASSRRAQLGACAMINEIPAVASQAPVEMTADVVFSFYFHAVGILTVVLLQRRLTVGMHPFL